MSGSQREIKRPVSLVSEANENGQINQDVPIWRSSYTDPGEITSKDVKLEMNSPFQQALSGFINRTKNLYGLSGLSDNTTKQLLSKTENAKKKNEKSAEDKSSNKESKQQESDDKTSETSEESIPVGLAAHPLTEANQQAAIQAESIPVGLATHPLTEANQQAAMAESEAAEDVEQGSFLQAIANIMQDQEAKQIGEIMNQLALNTRRGDYYNGQDRMDVLGQDYAAIQRMVNEQMLPDLYTPAADLTEYGRRVLNNEYGNNDFLDRWLAAKKAGQDLY